MRNLFLCTLAACAVAATSAAASWAADDLRFPFTLQTTGGLEIIGYNRTWQTPMSATRPDGIKKEPA